MSTSQKPSVSDGLVVKGRGRCVRRAKPLLMMVMVVVVVMTPTLTVSREAGKDNEQLVPGLGMSLAQW